MSIISKNNGKSPMSIISKNNSKTGISYSRQIVVLTENIPNKVYAVLGNKILSNTHVKNYLT
ncbi:unnamed protein product [Debaryomyces fabryi]|nr:unnamed protein product [Debaryomyces fabryi]